MLVAASFQTAADALVGRYTLDRAAGDDPAQVAEQTTRDVGRFKRGRMRDRLEEVLSPSSTLEIHRDGDAYVVSGEDGRSLRVVPGGPEEERETPEGEEAWVAATLEVESLVIRIRTSKAERVQTLTPNDVGLRVVNTYTLEQLDEPVRVEFVYRRDGT
jgi:hypothetical protein